MLSGDGLGAGARGQQEGAHQIAAAIDQPGAQGAYNVTDGDPASTTDRLPGSAVLAGHLPDAAIAARPATAMRQRGQPCTLAGPQ